MEFIGIRGSDTEFTAISAADSFFRVFRAFDMDFRATPFQNPSKATQNRSNMRFPRMHICEIYGRSSPTDFLQVFRMPGVFLQKTPLPVSKIRGKHPAKPSQNAHFLPKTGDFSAIFSATVFLQTISTSTGKL
jgi:hypothetical protein